MKTEYSVFLFLIIIHVIHCGVLLWGTHDIQIPALQEFNDNDLDEILKEKNLRLIAFKIESSKIPKTIKKLLINKYKIYIPNVRLNVENFTELTGDDDEDYRIVKEAIEENEHEFGANNILALIVESDSRTKREVQYTTTFNTEAVTQKITYAVPEGPILYSAKDKDLNEAMVFSSKPPLLQTNTNSILLGAMTVAQLDTRGSGAGSYSRLIVTIPVEDGKVTLRFKFPWENGYWNLKSVEVLDTDSKSYNLTVTQDVTAPRRFSYHCGGKLLFADLENNISLYLMDIQVQPDALNHRFNDAYDCVPFTTGPICSGLFVTSILMIGLAMGFGALASIKTMDKFDNHKTKQLSITVSE